MITLNLASPSLCQTLVSTQISAYLADISSWMAAYQLKFLSAKLNCCSFHMIHPSSGSDMFNFIYNIDSSIFIHIVHKSIGILTLDSCNSLLAGLPLSTIQPLQLIKEATLFLLLATCSCLHQN